MTVWDTVFGDLKEPKKAGRKILSAIPVKDIDILSWSYGDRQKLVSKGNRIRIFAGDVLITDISRPLFRATSEIAAVILRNGDVKLPDDTDIGGVIQIVNHLEAVIKFKHKPNQLSKNMTMLESLSICAAANLLGMSRYVDHIYKRCEALLRKGLPTYENLDAIIAFSKHHERLFSIVVNDLAVHVRDDTIPDVEEFNAYLMLNPILDATIKEVNEKYATNLLRQAEREERRIPFWDEKKAKAATLEISCQKKALETIPKDRKFTSEERMHWLRTKGKQPPKGC
ncbi:uncharacterized protein K460DRAFT_288836 [Cucurbitaria berberidis CBS 394.84]|uniref:Uncharacterized protein n=1 Tax=Cucurbitaria berberidis CBS 394.84 TaxID=1168544 RepID=A0A9P4GC87_9PLEO|nr:uncharacterized protein K460DRAFT_288836 [Cucurbitaria berberidis CBS 394.84]KAF1842940.1 hypothetical protein K460DRAFT_288836 [Cucurbitaria berberidis CBS 394.84]